MTSPRRTFPVRRSLGVRVRRVAGFARVAPLTALALIVGGCGSNPAVTDWLKSNEAEVCSVVSDSGPDTAVEMFSLRAAAEVPDIPVTAGDIARFIDVSCG